MPPAVPAVFPLLHYMETLPVRNIHTPAGETVLNFGQNFAGHGKVPVTIQGCHQRLGVW